MKEKEAVATVAQSAEMASVAVRTLWRNGCPLTIAHPARRVLLAKRLITINAISADCATVATRAGCYTNAQRVDSPPHGKGQNLCRHDAGDQPHARYWHAKPRVEFPLQALSEMIGRRGLVTRTTLWQRPDKDRTAPSTCEHIVAINNQRSRQQLWKPAADIRPTLSIVG